MTLSRLLTPLLLTSMALVADPARTSASENGDGDRHFIRDHANLFGPSAVANAEEAIALMSEHAPFKGLYVETIKSLDSLPSGWTKQAQEQIKALPKEAKLTDDEAKATLFAKLAEQRMGDLTGVYVLICQKPQFVQVSVSPDVEAQNLFSQANRDEIQRKFVNCLKFSQAPSRQSKVRELVNKARVYRPDYGLARVVEITERRLSTNRPSNNAAWLWSVTVIAGSIVLWIVLGIVQSKLKQSARPVIGVGSSSEEGLPVAPLGGASGAVAGEWLFRKLKAPEPAPVTVLDRARRESNLPTNTGGNVTGAGSNY